MCEVCSEGYFSNGAECDRCEEPNLTSFTPLIVALCAVVMLLLASVSVIRGFADRFYPPGKLAIKLKVLITTYQIVGTFTWTLGTAFPASYTAVVNFFLFMSLDITDLIPVIDCFYRYDYLTGLCVVTGFPLFLAMLIIFWWKLARCRASDEAKKLAIHARSIQASILLTFLVYAPVASKIFRALRPCDGFADIGTSFMPEDYTIVCGSPKHTNVENVAWAMFAIYCVGIPVFYFLLLCPKRRDIQRQFYLVNMGGKRTLEAEAELANLDAKLRSVSFLFQSYRDWWWEFVEVLRKLFLAGIIALISPGSVEQSVVLMILALVSTVLYHRFLPLRDDNLLGLVASYTVFFSAFASLLIKLRTDYLVSPVLDASLVVIIVSPIVFAIVLDEWILRSLIPYCCSESRRSQFRAMSAFFRKEFGRSPVQNFERELRLGEDKEGMLGTKSQNTPVPLKAKAKSKAEESI